MFIIIDNEGYQKIIPFNSPAHLFHRPAFKYFFQGFQ